MPEGNLAEAQKEFSTLSAQIKTADSQHDLDGIIANEQEDSDQCLSLLREGEDILEGRVATDEAQKAQRLQKISQHLRSAIAKNVPPSERAEMDFQF